MGLYQMPFQFVLAGVLLASTATLVTAQARPGCQDQCGEVSIPFPFGVGEGCYLNRSFEIKCNDSFHPKQPFFGNVHVKNITVPTGELRIFFSMARACYNETGSRLSRNRPRLRLDKFTISDTQNKFMAIGCDTYATIQGYRGEDRFTTGCMSVCDSPKYVNDSCSGVGCCEIPIPEGLKNVSVRLSSYNNHENITWFNNCSYAFVVENRFNFSSKYLRGFGGETKHPMVLEWAVGDESCELAAQNKSSFLCRANSTCDGSYNGPGYRCKCLDGFEGNAYLHGCQDINECGNPSLNECEKQEYCANNMGNYTCICPKGFHGDGRKGGKGCIRSQIQLVEIALGISICSVAVVAGSAWLYLVHKKRTLIKLKEQFFKQNGGLMLQQQLAGRESSSEAAQIFTAEELKKATGNYDESRIVGRGGYGTVYKGVLEGNKMVAIKKSKIVDQSQIEQFINEVVVLSQINHRNVVKLLGCCLEEEVPLLVYEFVTKGTLFDHIHNKGQTATIPWKTRLRIAAETAGVLSYLHSAASIPIIHRDVKTTNILLDENYTAKVSDFGASRLVPVDQTQLSTMVQGTLGYLDPEYLHTSQLTEKSDVYSFGVVLVELLTGRKALAFDRPEEERSLAMYFLSSLRKDRLFDILESHLLDEGNKNQIMEVAKLAMRCLEVKGEERPSMKEVAMELEGLRLTEKHPWVNVESNSEETEYLLQEKPSDSYNYGGSSNNASSGYDSIRSHVVILPLDNGR
ncbi:hypothetical protein PTKIN_Ptkin09bG0171000 [Pterospermum kingtungense]